MVDDDGQASATNCDDSNPAFGTVSDAIAAAGAGDTVLVCPGTFVENINFGGKAIAVRSVAGPAVTILDGNAADSVVKFQSGEGAGSVLEGFTIRNGLASSSGGGGVSIVRASPVIRGNNIVANRACTAPGVYVESGSPLIEQNTIAENVQAMCSGGPGGGGILLIYNAPAVIRQNDIRNNGGDLGAAAGGGIAVFSAGSPTIERNVIRGNRAREGGGISLVNQSAVTIVGNLIVGNTAVERGGGMAWRVSIDGRGPLVVNNTIADNDNPSSSGISAEGFDRSARLANNLIVALSGQTAIHCEEFGDPVGPAFERGNNVYSAAGTAYAGDCDVRSFTGNISADPLFWNPAGGDYHLRPLSPCIDGGTNSVEGLPAYDIDGFPRILPRAPGPPPIVDIGADEVAPAVRHVQIDAPAAGDVKPPFVVSGWAIDGSGANSGVDAVHIWAHPADGSGALFLGVAQYGLARGDVAAAFNDPRYANSGFVLNVRRLRAGTYLLVAYPHSTRTGTFDVTARVSITVRSQPQLTWDTPAGGATIRGPLRMSGWAVDYGSSEGTGVDAVHVYAFPAVGGAPLFGAVATYGLPRPDVAAALGDARFASSGWALETTLPPGTYQVAVYARSVVAQAFNQVLTRVITIAGSTQPQMVIDTPVPGATLSQPFTISGWAIDLGAASGPGVDDVHVYAFPNPGSGRPPQYVGVANYGTARPDVAAAFGDSQFENSGYALAIGALAPGRYLLGVYARSTVTNTFNNMRTVVVDVRSSGGPSQKRPLPLGEN